MRQLTLLADYAEEYWPSMEYVGEMLEQALRRELSAKLQVQRYRPPFAPVWGRVRGHHGPTATTPDRILNRYLAYPLAASLRRKGYWHVEDHSYAHLALATPAARTGIFVHDLDAIRCLFDRNTAQRGAYRWIAKALLAGMRQAALLFYSTKAVQQELLATKLVAADRLIHAPYGFAEEFTAQGSLARLPDSAPYLLHVGSCIPRKRIDTLIEAFALAMKSSPDLQLVKVGGEWSESQKRQIEDLGISRSLHHFQGLSRSELAAWYRGAAAVVVPSESEGFGLPIIEALACGAPVVASKLSVFEELAAGALVTAPVGDSAAFAAAINAVLKGSNVPKRALRIAATEPYSWSRHAHIVGEAYLSL